MEERPNRGKKKGVSCKEADIALSKSMTTE